MKETNYVLSTKISLFRNINNYDFVNNLSINEANQLKNNIFKAVNICQNYKYYNLDKLDSLTIDSLLEKGLINNEVLLNKEIVGLFLSLDETESIVINNSEHITIQTCLKGFSINNCYAIINDIDNDLSKQLNFAFSQKYGYLTSTPKLLGTALNIQVDLFLPALSITQGFDKLYKNLSLMGVAVLDNSRYPLNYMYRISNIYTLGLSEQEIIKNINDAVDYIINQEKIATKYLLNDREFLLNDLKKNFDRILNDNNITISEFLNYISKIRVANTIGIINIKNQKILDNLIDDVKPATLKLKFKIDNVDLKRAELVKNVVNKLEYEIN